MLAISVIDVVTVPDEIVVQSSSRELVPALTSWTRVGAGGISVSRYHKSLQHTCKQRHPLITCPPHTKTFILFAPFPRKNVIFLPTKKVQISPRKFFHLKKKLNVHLRIPDSLVGVSSAPDVHPGSHDSSAVTSSRTRSLFTLIHLFVRGTQLPRHRVWGKLFISEPTNFLGFSFLSVRPPIF